tara:strand:- start:175 stop:324 length:150 start_codon:yes stop_codon:yes gene_type:complete
VKARGSTPEGLSELPVLRGSGASGIPGVEVKFVEIRRNTGGEGGWLGPL